MGQFDISVVSQHCFHTYNHKSMSGSWYFLVVKAVSQLSFRLRCTTTPSPHHDSTESLLFYMSSLGQHEKEVQRKGHILGGQLAPRKLHLLPFYAILFEKRCLSDIFLLPLLPVRKITYHRQICQWKVSKDSEVLIVSKS